MMPSYACPSKFCWKTLCHQNTVRSRTLSKHAARHKSCQKALFHAIATLDTRRYVSALIRIMHAARITRTYPKISPAVFPAPLARVSSFPHRAMQPCLWNYHPCGPSRCPMNGCMLCAYKRLRAASLVEVNKPLRELAA